MVLEPPIGFTRLTTSIKLLRNVTPASGDIEALVATACVQQKLYAAFRREDGGADPLPIHLWQLPQWRSYFEEGIIRLELPLLDYRGRPLADGRTARNCEREIFIDSGTLASLIDELRSALLHPAKTDPVRPPAKRGPTALVSERVVKAMQSDIVSGKKTWGQLTQQTENSLQRDYDASRDTVRKARDKVRPVETLSKLPSANDK